MSRRLTETTAIEQPPAEFLAGVGTIFKVFGPDTQDSGNVSYGVATDAGRYFVKTTDPYASVILDFDARVELLRNAVRVAASCPHPALPALFNVIESPAGPLLVYEWAAGDLLREPAARERFRALPADDVVAVLDQVFDLHAVLARTGRVAVDFYDGCLIYDFATRRLHVVDLDGYHPGPFRNTMGRLFGSSRFMAPEEFELGQTIDQRTTVFTMGRTAAVLLADGTLGRDAFRGHTGLHAVVARACRASPSERFASVAEFHEAWQRAR